MYINVGYLNNFLVKEKAVHMGSNWCLESVV